MQVRCMYHCERRRDGYGKHTHNDHAARSETQERRARGPAPHGAQPQQRGRYLSQSRSKETGDTIRDISS